MSPGSPALNVAFDVTPARLVTGLITERGIRPATRSGWSLKAGTWREAVSLRNDIAAMPLPRRLQR